MTARKVMLLICDDCGEVYDDGESRLVREAITSAARAGWRRWRNSDEWFDRCPICCGTHIRLGDHGIVPIERSRGPAAPAREA